MRTSLPCLLFALLAVGCRDTAPVKKPATASPARVPIALLGTWVRTPSRDASHDTLVLRADSIATGWLRLESDSSTVIAVSRWTVAFLSRDPAVARTDMPGRYQDGGDFGCMKHPDSTCVSAPVLCLGPVGQPHCQGMSFKHDTLWLSGEGRYVRVARRDSVVP